MPQPTRYQEQLEALSEDTRRRARQTYERMTAAGYSVDDIADAIGPVLLSASIQAQSFAQAETALQVATGTGTDLATSLVTELESLPDIDLKVSALRRALLKREGEARATMLEQFAANDPLEAGQYAMGAAMRHNRNVAGYVRRLESEACELCHWLYRDGYIYPPQRPMTTHPGCLCSMEVVTPAQLIEAAEYRFSRTTRHGQQQRELWIRNAELAAENGTVPDEWINPGKVRNADEITL